MSRHRQRNSRWVRRAMSIVAGVLFSVASLERADDAKALAQTAGLESAGGYQSGQVTGKSGNSVQINKRDYPLAKDVAVKDDEGRPRELKDIKEGAEVLFHLRRDGIDQLIVVLPK